MQIFILLIINAFIIVTISVAQQLTPWALNEEDVQVLIDEIESSSWCYPEMNSVARFI